MDSARRGAIEAALNWALLTNDEMSQYEDTTDVPASLAAAFPNPIFIRQSVN
jgi:hypothetical protein